MHGWRGGSAGESPVSRPVQQNVVGILRMRCHKIKRSPHWASGDRSSQFSHRPCRTKRGIDQQAAVLPLNPSSTSVDPPTPLFLIQNVKYLHIRNILRMTTISVFSGLVIPYSTGEFEPRREAFAARRPGRNAIVRKPCSHDTAAR